MSTENHPVKKVSIIVSRGSLDGIYPALIMATGARMEGIEASLFFTFFGLNALVEKTLDHLKVATVGNPALNMAMPPLNLPITMPFPTCVGAIPGVSAFATGLMSKEIFSSRDRHRGGNGKIAASALFRRGFSSYIRA